MIIKLDDEYAVTKNLNQKNFKNPFKNADVQLATLSSSIPKGNNWLFEIKYDGYRILSYVENNKVKMLTRNNKDYTDKFESISKNLLLFPHTSFVVDGEIVVFDNKGKSDFNLLQNNLKSKKNNYYYVIFDLLALDGEDLRNLPLIKRKEKLQLLLANSEKNIINSSYLINKGKESFNLAKENNLEGIIAKKINSKYLGKRNDDWLKIKCYMRQEFVIGGFTTSEKNEYLSAILVGYYDKNHLIYAGKVGTGFNEEQKIELNKLFKAITTFTCPFSNLKSSKHIIWLQPKYVAEIQFVEFTKTKQLRQPSFINLRMDKNPKDIVLEIDNAKN